MTGQITQLQIDAPDGTPDLEARLGVVVSIRSMVLIIGAVALRYTTETEGPDRERAWAEFEELRDKIAFAYRHYVSDFYLDGVEDHKRALQAFSAKLAELTCESERRLAIEVDRMGQSGTLAALYGIIGLIDQNRDEEKNDLLGKAEAQSKALQDSFNEMERIGQFIRLISLNASVEAARTGGDAGRAFMVIADEVRNLATRSAKLLASTRDVLNNMEGETN